MFFRKSAHDFVDRRNYVNMFVAVNMGDFNAVFLYFQNLPLYFLF
ncbi:hypothetical protein SDC9_183762 [bioreactor metagenome]|uniref:Uncharacterized protein n=1 Tax=bioreactor metagenome TaxID=1076179 RepID=A0A645HKW5_9ZZZZ